MQTNLNSALCINVATVVKSQAGRIMKVSVLVAGTGPGSVNDTNDLTRPALQNQIAVIPAAVGVYPIEFQCRNGITIVPGPGQTLAIAYI